MKYKFKKEDIEFLLANGNTYINGDGYTYVKMPNNYKIDEETCLVEIMDKYYLEAFVELEENEVNNIARELVLSQYDSEDHPEYNTAYNMAIITINHLINKH